MSSITDKLITANSNVPKVYNAGCRIADKKPYINTSAITDFTGFFKNDHSLLSYSSFVDTSNGTIFANMFDSCSFQTAPAFNTSKGIDFGGMFANCQQLTSVPTIDTSNGTIFSGMFSMCSNLTAIPSIDTSNGTRFHSMFSSCYSLVTIPILDVSNAEGDGGDEFSGTFGSCYSLKNITFTGTINASISFSDCLSLTASSLQSIVYALGPESHGQYTITLSSNSWTVLEATTPPTGFSTWKEYIDHKYWLYA